MKMCSEVIMAIDEICNKYDQSDEFKKMLKLLIENSMEENLNPSDIEGIVKKVDLHED